jgi:hypothetical protein
MATRTVDRVQDRDKESPPDRYPYGYPTVPAEHRLNNSYLLILPP